jgi:alkylation response protein AidB-like acyl-CoA dehydrogenase
MDFQLSQEQQMLKDSARRFLEAQCGFEQRTALIARGSFDTTRWQAMAELGWLAMAIPEQYDGLQASPIDMAILMEEMGRVLFVEPYWAVALLAAHTIASAGDPDWAQRLLPGISTGERLPVLAHSEPQARGELAHVSTTAARDANGAWRLSGRKTLVIGGNAADAFIVSARTDGATSAAEGISLFMLNRDTRGLAVHDVRLIDNRWCVDLVLDQVILPAQHLLGKAGAAYTALEDAHAHALLGLCAEAVGVMDKALWITRDYLKVRKQFGATLNTFQSLQHRMSEMLIEVELARSMLHRALAAMALAPEQRQRALSAAKIQIGRSGKFVCAQAIQLHGGIGVTEEYVIGHHFKRMTAIEYALGNSHQHLERLAQYERGQAA